MLDIIIGLFSLFFYLIFNGLKFLVRRPSLVLAYLAIHTIMNLFN